MCLVLIFPHLFCCSLGQKSFPLCTRDMEIGTTHSSITADAHTSSGKACILTKAALLKAPEPRRRAHKLNTSFHNCLQEFHLKPNLLLASDFLYIFNINISPALNKSSHYISAIPEERSVVQSPCSLLLLFQLKAHPKLQPEDALNLSEQIHNRQHKSNKKRILAFAPYFE